MAYLIGQIVLCLLIAFALGFIIGCLFCRSSGLVADAPDWAGRYERLRRDYDRLQRESEKRNPEATASAEADGGGWVDRLEQLQRDHERLKEENDHLQRQCDEWRAKYDAMLVADGAAKAAQDGRGEPGDSYPYPVEEVEGIGRGFGRKLRSLGIETTEDLLRRCCTREGWERVADEIGLKERYVVRRWASMSDLMRVPGIMGQFAELLEFSDVNSVQDLASRDPVRLLEKLEEVNRREHRVKEVPSLEMVISWIERAKSMDVVMQV